EPARVEPRALRRARGRRRRADVGVAPGPARLLDVGAPTDQGRGSGRRARRRGDGRPAARGIAPPRTRRDPRALYRLNMGAPKWSPNPHTFVAPPRTPGAPRSPASRPELAPQPPTVRPGHPRLRAP